MCIHLLRPIKLHNHLSCLSSYFKTVFYRFRCLLNENILEQYNFKFIHFWERRLPHSVVWLVLHYPPSCVPIFCPTKASKTTQICRFILNIKSMITFQFAFLASLKGRVSPPKRMNFRKSSKQTFTPPWFSENHIVDFFRNSWPKTVYNGKKTTI